MRYQQTLLRTYRSAPQAFQIFYQAALLEDHSERNVSLAGVHQLGHLLISEQMHGLEDLFDGFDQPSELRLLLSCALGMEVSEEVRFGLHWVGPRQI